MDAAARIEGLDAGSRLQHALDASYRYLGRRDRTAFEVRRQLEGALVDPATIDDALLELERLGYVDDVRYARRFAEDRRQLDGWGTERIERRLLAVGVPPAIVEGELATRAAQDELAAAIDVLRRRMTAPPADDHERDRALGLLARRGYSLELAYDAVRSFERD